MHNGVLFRLNIVAVGFLSIKIHLQLLMQWKQNIRNNIWLWSNLTTATRHFKLQSSFNRKQLETLVIFFGSQNKASNTATSASLMTCKNKKHKNIINKTSFFWGVEGKLPFDSPGEVLIRFLHRSKVWGLTCFSWCHLAGPRENSAWSWGVAPDAWWVRASAMLLNLKR